LPPKVLTKPGSGGTKSLQRGAQARTEEVQALADLRGAKAAARAMRSIGAVSLAALQLSWALPAVAQLAPSPLSPTPFPGQPVPGRNVPPPAPPLAPQFEFSIPAPQRGPVPRAVDAIEFDVTDIKVTGATKFPASAFRPLYAPLLGKKAHLSDIIGVADKIEALYREHGYVLTRAYVPPQTVSGGVFQINVVEGYVKAAAVSGGDDDTRSRVQAYVDPVTKERPATLGTMERGLLMANDLPGTTASGLLRPSPTEPGASDLLVTLNQEPWEVTLYSDNRGAEITGPVTVGIQAIANTTPFTTGQFMVDLSGTPDFSERRLFQGHYVRPIGDDGMLFTLQGVVAHGEPAALGGNLVSNSDAVGVRLSYPLIVSRPTRVTLEGGLTIQMATVEAASAAAGLAAGLGTVPVYNDDQWRDADVALTVQRRGLLLDSLTAATIGVTQGLPILGAYSTTPFADALGGVPAYPGADAGGSLGFTKYTLVVTHDQPVTGPISLNFHGIGQWTNERLVIGEQTSFGGSGIGRGYDPASLSADAGAGLASEVRYDMHLPQYHLDTTQFYYFFDAARILPRRSDEPPPIPPLMERNSLLSTGFGVRVALLERVTGGIEFAQELRGVPNNDQGKTGARILFNAAVRF
jgi:hemolysin activation/secretion protein